MLLKVTGSRNNLPLRVQSPDEAPISKDKFGFSLKTEEYDSIKSRFLPEINVTGKFKYQNQLFCLVIVTFFDLGPKES